ncbi:hypothetical protein J1605_021105 [Eschrichtius robustus]|uniref:deoxyribose-phosphate aldolase n=1 Tax=Eschrichtius robustus TaxID=9764 RepID=A0AB34HH12_ESCRO|nr:hypothetical protein J1605_021105 [Eschrichtius robustus]
MARGEGGVRADMEVSRQSPASCRSSEAPDTCKWRFPTRSCDNEKCLQVESHTSGSISNLCVSMKGFFGQLDEPTVTYPSSELDLLASQCDLSWISKIQVNQPAVLRRAEQIQARRPVKKEWQAAWLLKAVTFLDLTTLSGDDTSSNIQRLCYKAKYPIREDLLKALNMHDKGITTAAVCVYPACVCDAVKALKAAGCDIPVASVATGFPAGQTHLKTRLEEIRLAVEDGASEIDVVINRTLVLTGQWEDNNALLFCYAREILFSRLALSCSSS